MGQKGQPHPQRFGRSQAWLNAKAQNDRSAENERIAAESEKVEADDVARHPDEADYQ